MPLSNRIAPHAFIDGVAGELQRLPGVEAVALGGSRAQGTNQPDSDWDVAVYYRRDFDPKSIASIGWPGQLSSLGGWGAVFNGGGKLTVDEQLVDIHYRDLELIDEIHDEALVGRFTIEPMLFHQAGLPAYILLAELGINQTLRGQLPAWEYPDALRESAPKIWWERADLTLEYARSHARHGRVAQCAGLISEASCQASHAILAQRAEWVTNETQLLTKAGLRTIDALLSDLGTEPGRLSDAVAAGRKLIVDAGQREGLRWR